MADYTRGDDPAYNGFREGWERSELNEIVYGIDLDRLREICEAEREERCVVLPQRGDKLFYAPYPSGAKGQDGEPMFLRNTGDGSGIVERVAVHVYFNNWSRPVPLKKTWKTRAEAETAKGEAE